MANSRNQSSIWKATAEESCANDEFDAINSQTGVESATCRLGGVGGPFLVFLGYFTPVWAVMSCLTKRPSVAN